MPMQYDGRRETRIYHPEHNKTLGTNAEDARIGFTQPLNKPKSVFDGISIAQVVAGAAAAATSMLLASKIGIAGSVIGAAVSSAVTIVCSQLYRHALDASAQKLRDSKLASSVDANLPGTRSNRPAPGTLAVSGFDTSVPNEAAIRRARTAPIELQMRAAEDRSGTQRKVVLISIAIAIAAVVLCAGTILLGTAGQGLGERPAPILSQPQAAQPAEGTPSREAGTEESGNSADNGANPNDVETPNTETDGSQMGNESSEPGANDEQTGQDTSSPDASNNAGNTSGDASQPNGDAETQTGESAGK